MFSDLQKKSALFSLFLLISITTLGQYYNLGQDPASIRWRQINSSHFRLVFPADFEVQAQRMMNILDCVYSADSKTLAHNASKIPFIFHTSDITPNAFTIWAPKRIELFTCSSQNTYTQNWMEQLAIHEYRHAVQTDRMNRGLTKVFSYLLGEQAPAAVLGLYIPLWFMEGDAVCAETALSHSGRGRVPNFEQDIRTQVLEKGSYKYDKAVFGSFRHFVPDQYALGYQIVANTRKNYGYTAWTTAMDEAAKKPYGITSFSHGLKKATGKTKVGLFNETMSQLGRLWKEQAMKTTVTAFNKVSPVSKIHTNYKYPHYLSDSMVLAERSGMDDISRFVIINSKGREKVIFTPGFFSTDAFSIQIGTGFKETGNKPGVFTADNITISNGLIAWTEKVADPRWENRTYSVIKLYDFSTGASRQLTEKSRLFVPSLSPDGTRLAAISVSNDNTSSLLIIDVNSGMVTDTLLSARGDFLLTPSWSPDGKSIVYMILKKQGKSIALIDLKSRISKTIVAPTFTEISNPVFAEGYILFNGSWSGIENICAVSLKDNAIYQVTSSAYGACNADYNSATSCIVYSDYQAEGYQIAEAKFNPDKLIPIRAVADNSVKLYESLVKEEEAIIDSTTIGNKQYTSEKYSKIGHLFRFHSWAPLSVNPDNGTVNYGISFMSQNDLSTVTVQAGYEWDNTMRTGRTRASVNFAAWYPVIDISASTGKKAGYDRYNNGQVIRYTYNENLLSTGIRLPLLYSQGKYYTRLEPSVNSEIIYDYNNYSANPQKMEGLTNVLQYRFFTSHYIKQSTRDVYPKWGQTLDLNYRHSPFSSGNDMGFIAGASSFLFFPGLARHHGIKLYAAYQQRPSDYNYDTQAQKSYLFSNIISVPRGFNTNEEVRSIFEQQKLISLSANYKFPFLYPDLALGPFIYLKRLKANLFYDYAHSVFASVPVYYQSTGVEISSDMNIIRFLFPFDLGIRVGYKPDTRKLFYDFLFSINVGI
jgi:hypothetical protein